MYFFRADGNAVTGAGHLMRCLTIASELKILLKGAEEICFICADAPGAAMAEKNGFPVLELHTDYRDMQGELKALSRSLADWKRKAGDVFCVDSYYVTKEYLQALSAYGRVYVLDDMGETAYPVYGVINYNAFADRGHYEKLYEGQDTRLALGSRFVPLRRQFANKRYTVRDRVREVLVTVGGGDGKDAGFEVFEAVRRPGCLYHVVTGRFHRSHSRWESMEREDGCILLHHDVEDMASLMCRCDLAVTAGGTTVYELAAVGVPFLCFSLAKNQEALTEYVGREKIAGYCGAYHLDAQGTLRRMRELAGRLCAPDCAEEGLKLRKQMYRRERELTDGLGAGRIAGFLAGRGEGV